MTVEQKAKCKGETITELKGHRSRLVTSTACVEGHTWFYSGMAMQSGADMLSFRVKDEGKKSELS